ncbi:MAG: HAMP domain-containing protein [Alphaproteobacteria bacterium]|nr:HAMP domain-containing protein [Alphaproteobacteria bacterium]
MKPAPQRSLRFHMITVLVLGLLLSHGIGFLLYTQDRSDVVSATEEFDIAERASGVVGLLRHLPEDWRKAVLDAADSRAFRVWSSDASVLPSAAPSENEARVINYLRRLLPRLAGQEIRVSLTRALPENIKPPVRETLSGAGTAGSIETAAEIVVISIHHPDGFWLNFVGAISRELPVWPGLLGGYLISIVVGVAIIAFWLVNRATQPLNAFALAAERLGKDIQTAPIDEDAPAEVSRAAHAFNLMQERIARLVRNRTELLAAVSHDLRTPITQLKLRAETLEDDEEREKYLAALEEMEIIIATFLDYARSAYGSEERSLVDLDSLVESICSDMADAGANVACKGGPPVTLHCKRVALKRAVRNLIDNAVKYGGGAEVSTHRDGQYVIIRVDDSGPGIPHDDIGEMLMPFRRGDPSRSRETGGVGLGLSIAQAIAHDHGGRLALNNRKNGGLRAELILPA